MRHGWDGDVWPHYLATVGGEPVGWLVVVYSTWDNPDLLCWLQLVVAPRPPTPRPRHRARGGRASTVCRGDGSQAGRGIDGWESASTTGFAARIGMEQRARSVNRQQTPRRAAVRPGRERVRRGRRPRRRLRRSSGSPARRRTGSSRSCPWSPRASTTPRWTTWRWTTRGLFTRADAGLGGRALLLGAAVLPGPRPTPSHRRAGRATDRGDGRRRRTGLRSAGGHDGRP